MEYENKKIATKQKVIMNHRFNRFLISLYQIYYHIF